MLDFLSFLLVYIYSNIANQSNSKKCQVYLIDNSNLKPLACSLRFSPGTGSLAVTLWGSICDHY